VPSFVAGRIGRGEKPPPQFGHTLARTWSTHSAQNVHSNVQIIASVEFGGRGLLQFSQVGRSSSMGDLQFATHLVGDAAWPQRQISQPFGHISSR
jgi:hypothetical protein